MDPDIGVTAILETIRSSGEETTINIQGSDQERYAALKQIKLNPDRYGGKITIDAKSWKGFDSKEMQEKVELLRSGKSLDSSQKADQQVDQEKTSDPNSTPTVNKL